MFLCFHSDSEGKTENNSPNSDRTELVQMSANVDQHITPMGGYDRMGTNSYSHKGTKGRKHYKQTGSTSIMAVSMDEFAIKDIENDMQIIGDDEYDENAIITKQPTFENAENDQEIVNEEDVITNGGMKTKKYTLNIEGRHKKTTMIMENDEMQEFDGNETRLNDGSNEEDEYEDYLEEDDDDVILTMGAPDNKMTIGGSIDITQETIE